MLKKTIILLSLTITSILFLSTSTPVFAEDCEPLKDQYGANSYQYKTCTDNQKEANVSGSVFSGTCRSGFLGLTSWDCGVNIKDEPSLKEGIWIIVSNIATDITIIAAYLVLGYVIYGGYLYIFSSGDAGKVAAGKKTLTQAFIGLAIVMSAFVIMSTIRFALLGAGGKFGCDFMSENGDGCVDANIVVTNAIQWAIGIAGAVAAIFVVYGGISYTTSSGDPGKLQKAKQTIIYALIGLAIVALAEAITAFVSGMIRDADDNATSMLYHQTLISKESHENKTV